MPAWGGGKARKKRNQHTRQKRRGGKLCRKGKWKNKLVQKQTWLKTESCSNEFYVLAAADGPKERARGREKYEEILEI